MNLLGSVLNMKTLPQSRARAAERDLFFSGKSVPFMDNKEQGPVSDCRDSELKCLAHHIVSNWPMCGDRCAMQSTQ